MTAPVAYTHGVANLTTRLLRPWLGRPRGGFESDYGRIPGTFAPGEHHHYWKRWFPETEGLGHYSDPCTAEPANFDELAADLASLAAIFEHPLVFKNLYLSISSGLLARVLPDARFLIVARDPLLVCQSVLHGREQQADPRRWWSVKPPQYRDWLDLPLWQQVARQVFYADAIPRRDLGCFAPDRIAEMEYTALCRQPRACLEQLERWLAPLGYQSYPDSEIPKVFAVSDRLRLSPATAEAILSELAHLRKGFDAPSR
jgi:hypothetical protein